MNIEHSTASNFAFKFIKCIDSPAFDMSLQGIISSSHTELLITTGIAWSTLGCYIHQIRYHRHADYIRPNKTINLQLRDFVGFLKCVSGLKISSALQSNEKSKKVEASRYMSKGAVHESVRNGQRRSLQRTKRAK